MLREKETMAVFVESSLGTHLALSAPTGAVAGDLKRKIEGEHLCCFPSIGKIRVQSLMVKHKSVFYHLPDSIPAKEVFRGFAGSCFLYMVVSQLATLSDEEFAPPPTYKRSKELESIGQSEIMETTSRFTNTLTNNLLARDSLKSHSSSGLDINPETEEEEITTSGLITDSLENKGSSGSRFKTNAIKFRGNKTEADCPLHDKELAVFFLPSLSQKNQSKIRKLDSSAKMNQDEKGLGTCNKALRLECDYDQSFEEEEQNEDNSMANNSLCMNLKETAWSSEKQSVTRQNDISSSKETSPGNVSEKMSVTHLISRFFSDGDEVNSPNKPLINAMDADEVTVRSNTRLLKEYDTSQRSVSDTCGVFPLEPDHLGASVTDVPNERLSEDNIASSAEHSFYDEADNSNLAGNKFCRCRSLTNRKSNYRDYRGWIKSFPTCEICKYMVGKRLIQAANKIRSPCSEKRSSKLLNIRCKNMCSDIAKRFSFESSDSIDH